MDSEFDFFTSEPTPGAKPEPAWIKDVDAFCGFLLDVGAN
jgi:hypothetical protein